MWPHVSVHVHWSIHIRACDVLKCRCVYLYGMCTCTNATFVVCTCTNATFVVRTCTNATFVVCTCTNATFVARTCTHTYKTRVQRDAT